MVLKARDRRRERRLYPVLGGAIQSRRVGDGAILGRRCGHTGTAVSAPCRWRRIHVIFDSSFWATSAFCLQYACVGTRLAKVAVLSKEAGASNLERGKLKPRLTPMTFFGRAITPSPDAIDLSFLLNQPFASTCALSPLRGPGKVCLTCRGVWL